MKEVLNPFGRALAQGISFFEIAEADPLKAESLLRGWVEETKLEIAALTEFVYRLQGAEPECSTPMQYGGWFLERDREILESVRPNQHVTLWIDGGEGTYIDFVSDLPATVFAWDAEATGFSVEEMMGLRSTTLNPFFRLAD